MTGLGKVEARRVRAVDAALGALQDWISDERVSAEQRTGGSDAESVVADEVYCGHLGAWSAAHDALAEVKRRMHDEVQS